MQSWRACLICAKKGLLPGFEGVFAIAGLLAVAYLVMRKRRT
ncbi:MAG: PGF-CTERM sorting domain-containing protein [Methanosarcinales archaeon]|nr:PGF-CTERM sorting domain-containing protein [Methanosarcinales archaeon]